MSWLAGAVFIFGVGFGAMMMVAWLMSRPGPESRVERFADPAPMPGEKHWHREGWACDGSCPPPFPDTGPLLIWSDSMAAAQSITREVEEMTRAAERKARPWR